MEQRSGSRGAFSPESPLMSGLGRLTTVLVLGFLWTVTSLPVITVGASSSAIFYVMLKLQRCDEENALADYFKSFRQNLRQATGVWLLMLLLGGIFGFAFFYYGQMERTALQLIFGAVLLYWVAVLVYVFPIISRFENRFCVIMMMAVMLPFRNLKWTLALLLLAAAVIAVCLYITPLIFFAYGLFAFCAAFIFPKIFRPLETAIEENNDAITAVSQ